MADGRGQTAYSSETVPEVPGYRIERQLGYGSMGVVYLAEDLQLHRKVALKVLTPTLARDDLFRKRFDRESQSAATLDHPNIVPVYAAGQASGLLYIAMRYVRGGDLRTLLDTNGPLSLAQTSAVIASVADALDAAHAQGMIHRDVKPANILIDEHAGQEHYYLSDFGITKNVSGDPSLTSADQIVGTIDYVAPEQIQGKAVDARADLYALGCVLYQCLTGVVPYSRADTAALMWAHVHDEPVPVTTVRPDLPSAVDHIVATAMAKQPEDRYPSCRELALALRTISTTDPAAADGHGGAVPVHPPDNPSPPSPATRGMTSTYTPPVVAPAQTPATAPSKGRRKWWWIAAGVLTLALAGGATVGVMAYLRAHFPSAAEQALLQHVPPALRNSCTRAPVAEADALTVQASVSCPSTGDGPSTVSFTKYKSPQALDSHYQQAVASAGTGKDVGECVETDRAERTYTDSSGRTSGRIVCYQDLGSSIVTWTDNQTLTLATATRLDSDYPKLRDWWASVMGLPTRAQREEKAKHDRELEAEKQKTAAAEKENERIRNEQAEKDKALEAERKRKQQEEEAKAAEELNKKKQDELNQARAAEEEAERIRKKQAEGSQASPQDGGQQSQGPVDLDAGQQGGASGSQPPPPGASLTVPQSLPTLTLNGRTPPAPGRRAGPPVEGAGGCTPRGDTYVCALTQPAPAYLPEATNPTGSLNTSQPAAFLCQSEGPSYSAGNRINHWWAWANVGNTGGWVPTMFLAGTTDNGPVPGLSICSRARR